MREKLRNNWILLLLAIVALLVCVVGIWVITLIFPAIQSNTIESDATKLAWVQTYQAEHPATPTGTPEPTQTPVPSEELIIEPTLAPTDVVSEKEYVKMSFEEALQTGKVTVRIYAPWDETMVLTFKPKFVNFDEEGFGEACPYDQGLSCIDTFDGGGVYALTHSEYQDAVAEQARIIMEGDDINNLYKLSKITKHVRNLPGSLVEIKLSDGRYIKAVVSDVKRTVGLENIYDTAKTRYAEPGTLVLEFCGLPHSEDGTESAGWTGSVYQITIVME